MLKRHCNFANYANFKYNTDKVGLNCGKQRKQKINAVRSEGVLQQLIAVFQCRFFSKSSPGPDLYNYLKDGKGLPQYRLGRQRRPK
jgi:hypothetical protein